MFEIPTNPECPNCDRKMQWKERKRVKHYRHSEEMWYIRWNCDNCRTNAYLKYSLKTNQISYDGVKYNEHEY
jgi:C4-type Zn-finger protein